MCKIKHSTSYVFVLFVKRIADLHYNHYSMDMHCREKFILTYIYIIKKVSTQLLTLWLVRGFPQPIKVRFENICWNNMYFSILIQKPQITPVCVKAMYNKKKYLQFWTQFDDVRGINSILYKDRQFTLIVVFERIGALMISLMSVPSYAQERTLFPHYQLNTPIFHELGTLSPQQRG